MQILGLLCLLDFLDRIEVLLLWRLQDVHLCRRCKRVERFQARLVQVLGLESVDRFCHSAILHVLDVTTVRVDRQAFPHESELGHLGNRLTFDRPLDGAVDRAAFLDVRVCLVLERRCVERVLGEVRLLFLELSVVASHLLIEMDLGLGWLARWIERSRRPIDRGECFSVA